MSESVIIERVEDIVDRMRSAPLFNSHGDPALEAGNKVFSDYADRIEQAHKAEMREVLDMLKSALDVYWKFKKIFGNGKEGKGNA